MIVAYQARCCGEDDKTLSLIPTVDSGDDMAVIGKRAVHCHESCRTYANIEPYRRTGAALFFI